MGMTDAHAPLSRDDEPAARRSLLAAFAELTLTRRYRDFGVAAIVGSARVARSTFYYHFAGKDDLLLQNLQPLIAALSGMPDAPAPTSELEGWIAHIWEQRQAAGRLLAGSTGRKIEAALSQALRERLTARARRREDASMLAEQIAGASLSLLKAWVDHRVSSTAPDIAQALWRGARAMAMAMAMAE
jgi:AcrR family transcriptional regulator